MLARGRVLLLEDDPQIRRFVALVLAQLDVDLVECGTVSQAVAALEQAPVDVAICDLMLAGESGFDLMERIAASDTWRRARVVVFSAAIESSDRARMERLGVWGQLSKPTSVSDLLRCVEDALSARAAPSAPAVSAPPSGAEQDAAVARFFEGDRALFDAYRDSCRPQFLADLAQGDEACERADLPGLRRLAHSLKTVVASLGAGRLSEGFAVLEATSRDERLDDARRQWEALRAPLAILADPRSDLDA